MKLPAFGPVWVWLAVAALAQTAAVAKIVTDRQSVLRNGREIALAVVPVDPRDLFRGDYVTLGYTLNPIKHSALPPGSSFAEMDTGQTVFVTLRRSVDGSWRVVAVSKNHPRITASEGREATTNGAGTDPAAGTGSDVVMRGTVASRQLTPARTDESGGVAAFDVALEVRFGIERYFVPEGTGMALEEKIRDGTIEALVAVGNDGTAAIKGLIVGGTRHEDPPLY